MLVVVVAAQGCAGGASPRSGTSGTPASIVIPGAPRVTGGPYRLIPHPNYVAVVVEGIALPLVHSAWITALVFTVLQRRAAAHADQGRERRAREPDVIDLLVAGGGPAGLATALYGARAGLEVAVVERRDGVLDKACGEGMMPHTVAHLDRLGVTATGRPLRGISYVDGDRRVDATFRAGVGRGVRRTVLHAALWQAAEAAGVKLVHGELGEVTQDAESVCAGRFRARYLAAADGLHSPIRKALGCRSRARARAGGASAGTFEIAPWTDSVEVHWAPGAEAYVTPVADDCVGHRDPQLDPRRLRPPLRGVRRAAATGCRGHAHGQDRAAGPLRQKVAQPGGGPGAAGRRRGRLHRRAHRRGHGAGVRRRRTAGELRCRANGPRTTTASGAG